VNRKVSEASASKVRVVSQPACRLSAAIRLSAKPRSVERAYSRPAMTAALSARTMLRLSRRLSTALKIASRSALCLRLRLQTVSARTRRLT
jgi:hypothetical protein